MSRPAETRAAVANVRRGEVESNDPRDKIAGRVAALESDLERIAGRLAVRLVDVERRLAVVERQGEGQATPPADGEPE